MSTLTSKQRAGLSKSVFGIPSRRAYPMPDKNHAQIAKVFASRAFNAGRMSASQKAAIFAKANAVLGR